MGLTKKQNIWYHGHTYDPTMLKFSADTDNAFSFYEVFCEQHHQSVSYSHRLLYCVYLLKSVLKNRKCQKYSYFFESRPTKKVKLMQSLPMPTLLTVNMKIQTFWKRLEDDVQCPYEQYRVKAEVILLWQDGFDRSLFTLPP